MLIVSQAKRRKRKRYEEKQARAAAFADEVRRLASARVGDDADESDFDEVDVEESDTRGSLGVLSIPVAPQETAELDLLQFSHDDVDQQHGVSGDGSGLEEVTAATPGTSREDKS